MIPLLQPVLPANPYFLRLCPAILFVSTNEGKPTCTGAFVNNVTKTMMQQVQGINTPKAEGNAASSPCKDN
jgi:hypothetical protein